MDGAPSGPPMRPTTPALLAALALAACAGPVGGATAGEAGPREPVARGRSAASGGLVLDAQAWAAGDALRADLRLTNVGADAVRLGYGACSARLLGWPTPERAGPPALTTVVARSAEGYGYGCPLYLALTTLAAGETVTPDDAHELSLTASLAEVLGDAVPDGRYWLRAEFRLAERDGALAPDTLRADLGPLDLAAPRPPIAAEAVRLGAQFEVDSVRVEGGRVRAVLRVVPVPRMGPDVVAFAPCAARVLAFADAARRDAAPRAGPPDASAEAACGQPPPTPLDVPPDRRDEPPLYLAPERPHRAALDLALGDLLGGLPAGRYALAVAVRTLGPPGYDLRALPDVTLALGDADWRP